MNAGPANSAPSAYRNSDVWVVIPLYNEAEVIGGVVRGLLTEFPHVVCIDDGSTDGSGSIASSLPERILKSRLEGGTLTQIDRVREQTGASGARNAAGAIS